ncbi:saccharopine dehydrogenase family protein [Nocardia gipuzkoensis]
MRILALGGAGEMGRVAARVLVGDDRVERVVVTDLDARRAMAAAETLGPKATGLRLTVTDLPALHRAIGECDVVVNTVGPFFRFGPAILAAAIAGGRNYVDINDDWEPTLDMLDMDSRARDAGVTALVGMGASPGVANLLAVSAADALDTVRSVITGWNVDAAQPARHRGAPSAAVVHGMQQISGTVRVTRNGDLVDRPALEKVQFTYPGLGPALGLSFGHPEAVTLQRVFPGLLDSTNVVLGNRVTLAALRTLRWGLDRRLLTVDTAARLAALAEQLVPHNPADLIRPGMLPPMFALVTGTRDGQPASVAAALAQAPGWSMADNTGVPLGVAAPFVATATRPGVHTPETLLDPGEFFTALAPHCIGHPPTQSMIALTRSWATADDNADSLKVSLLTGFLADRVHHPA